MSVITPLLASYDREAAAYVQSLGLKAVAVVLMRLYHFRSPERTSLVIFLWMYELIHFFVASVIGVFLLAFTLGAGISPALGTALGASLLPGFFIFREQDHEKRKRYCLAGVLFITCVMIFQIQERMREIPEIFLQSCTNAPNVDAVKDFDATQYCKCTLNQSRTEITRQAMIERAKIAWTGSTSTSTSFPKTIIGSIETCAKQAVSVNNSAGTEEPKEITYGDVIKQREMYYNRDLRHSLAQSITADRTRAARAAQLARKTGEALHLVEQRLKEIETDMGIHDINIEKIRSEYTVLAMLLSEQLMLGSEDFKPIDSQSISQDSPSAIKACQDKAHIKWDTGVTSEMLKGNLVYQECLYDNIRIGLLETMKNNEQVETILSNLRLSVNNIIKAQHELENANKFCTPSCGTMWTTTPAASGHNVLENFLESVENTRRNHE